MTKKAIQITFKKLKYKKLVLDVKVINLRAIRVYEKCGFKIIRKTKDGKLYRMVILV
jgi:RimJ/RimL family protein N-acetyltransferase